MSIATAEGILLAMETLNGGTNHCCEYSLYRLPDAANIDESLAGYFSSLWTSHSPCQPAEAWHIERRPIGPSWREEITHALKKWFFEEQFSPPTEDYIQSALIESFLSNLLSDISNPELHEISVSPPMFYDCQWQDFAISSTEGIWLLHLGFSD